MRLLKNPKKWNNIDARNTENPEKTKFPLLVNKSYALYYDNSNIHTIIIESNDFLYLLLNTIWTRMLIREIAKFSWIQI